MLAGLLALGLLIAGAIALTIKRYQNAEAAELCTHHTDNLAKAIDRQDLGDAQRAADAVHVWCTPGAAAEQERALRDLQQKEDDRKRDLQRAQDEKEKTAAAANAMSKLEAQADMAPRRDLLVKLSRNPTAASAKTVPPDRDHAYTTYEYVDLPQLGSVTQWRLDANRWVLIVQGAGIDAIEQRDNLALVGSFGPDFYWRIAAGPFAGQLAIDKGVSAFWILSRAWVCTDGVGVNEKVRAQYCATP